MMIRVCFFWFGLFWAQSILALEPAKMEWAGDIRYRLAKGHEDIDNDRSYQQLRVRLGLKAEVNENVKAVVRLATGTSAISHNQTLGDANDPGMPRRGFGIDWAYLDWTATPFVNVWAGRTANPFWSPNRLELIFDGDLAFEGVGIKVKQHWGTLNSAFLNVGGYIVSEEFAAPDDAVDVGLVGGDIGYRLGTEMWGLTTHFGNYYYLNIQDKPITSFDKNASTDAYSYPFDSYRGNSVYPNDPLLPPDKRKYYFENKYVLLEAGTEWKQKLFSLVDGLEYTLFFDWVRNDKVRQQGIGSEYGASVRWNRVWVSAAKISKARDAVVGAFSDSDGNGGGTDTRGTKIQLGVQLAKNATLVATKFEAKRGVDTVTRNFSMTHLEVVVSF